MCNFFNLNLRADRCFYTSHPMGYFSTLLHTAMGDTQRGMGHLSLHIFDCRGNIICGN